MPRFRRFRRRLATSTDLALWILLAVSLFPCMAVAGVYALTFGWRVSESHQIWAEAGDFFGGVLGPVLSLISFAGVLYALRLQAHELRMSRKQHRKSMQAAEDHAASVREHHRQLVQDSLLGSFLRLLEHHISIVSRIDITSDAGKRVVGHDCFVAIQRKHAGDGESIAAAYSQDLCVCAGTLDNLAGLAEAIEATGSLDSIQILSNTVTPAERAVLLSFLGSTAVRGRFNKAKKFLDELGT